MQIGGSMNDRMKHLYKEFFKKMRVRAYFGDLMLYYPDRMEEVLSYNMTPVAKLIYKYAIDRIEDDEWRV